jgi:phage terminase small subunit
MTTKLTPKQEAFYRAYLETGNANEAYRRSYNSSKMKPETINRRAQDLMKHGIIAARIAANTTRLRNKAEQQYDVTQERILKELALLGFSNMMDYVSLTDDGLACVDFSALTRDQAAAIHEIKVDRVALVGGKSKADEAGKVPQIEKVTFKLADKRAALVDLGKHLGMFIERSENINTNYNISDKPMDEDDWTGEYAESSDAVH